MNIRIGSKDAPPASLEGMAAEIRSELDRQQGGWLKELSEQPTRLGRIEQQVHNAFAALADRMVVGLLAEASQSAALQAAQKKS